MNESAVVKAANKAKDEDDEESEISERQQNFIMDLIHLINHLKTKVDPHNKFYTEYKLLSLYACMFGSVDISLTQGSSAKLMTVTKWSVLRRAIKANVVRSKSRSPSVPDLDAASTSQTDIVIFQQQPVSHDVTIEQLEAFEPLAKRLVEFLEEHDIKKDVATYMSSAKAFGDVMVQLLPIITSGSPPETPEFFERMVLSVVVNVVMTIIPAELGSVGEHCKKVKVEPCDELRKAVPWCGRVMDGQLPDDHALILKAMRWRLLAHLFLQVKNLQFKGKPALRDSTLIYSDLLVHDLSRDDWKTATILEIETAKGIDFKDAADIWWDTMSKVATLLSTVDDAALMVDEQQTRTALMGMKVGGVAAFVAQHKLKVQVPQSIDMLPTQRAAVFDQIIVELDGKNLGSDRSFVKSWINSDIPGKAKLFRDMLIQDHGPPAIPTIQDSETSGAGTSESGAKSFTLTQWFQDVASGEVCDFEASRCSFTRLEIKRLIAQLSSLPQFQLDSNEGECWKALEIQTQMRPNKVKIVQVRPGHVSLTLGGSIVVAIAHSLNITEASMLPLGAGGGIFVFLDGSKCNNIEQTDCSIAWCVRRQQKEEATQAIV